ncbi:hypothetical protein COV18_07095 [Candidatus Woesearchaeota archaeon CG10_big_fil_rev_8_21_14_0_10_37_12]|nr:MAG: hypothetical protein COV18_07095 [Candidatus Woesearchaeota archaeon CG10_big_fil_rev_8_21_14_0_10_37_12]
MEQITKEVVLTYQTLYEILRKEKSRPELQKIDGSFFKDVLQYSRDKQHQYDENLTKNDIFSQSERDKLHIQITNIKKILKDLYDFRERKIINMAINKSRTNSQILDTENLLRQEKQLFEHITSILNQNRTGILHKLLELREPDVMPFVLPLEEDTYPDETNLEQQENTGIRKVKFTEDVDQFAGPDLELYGPYAPEEEADLPTEVANVLIAQGKAA